MALNSAQTLLGSSSCLLSIRAERALVSVVATSGRSSDHWRSDWPGSRTPNFEQRRKASGSRSGSLLDTGSHRAYSSVSAITIVNANGSRAKCYQATLQQASISRFHTATQPHRQQQATSHNSDNLNSTNSASSSSTLRSPWDPKHPDKTHFLPSSDATSSSASSSRSAASDRELSSSASSASTWTSPPFHSRKEYPIANPYQELQLPSKFGKNQEQLVSEEKRKELEQIVGQFKAVRWAVAYGSGVFGQDGYDKAKGPAPMVDFIFATAHPSHFHALNLQHNPSHYPLFARWLGSDYISKVQEWGAGVWYCTMVEVEGQPIKYGVIGTDDLCADLMDWTTLYISGRMHKPVRIIRRDPRILLANQVNLASALRVALLMLPEEFTEVQLWEQVAGISYAGDPRMSIPGGENPRKVRNIVRPQIQRFRLLYARLLEELGKVEPAPQLAAEASKAPSDVLATGALQGTDEENLSCWRRLGLTDPEGKGILRQPSSAAHREGLLRKLPRQLKKAVETRYAYKMRVQVLHVVDDQAAVRKAAESAGKEVVEEAEFWSRVADQPNLRKVIDQEIRNIIRTPATKQSLKGLLTAGFRKSVVYASKKVTKWWKAVTSPSAKSSGSKKE